MKYFAESAGRDLSPLFFISARRCALTARGSSTPEERVSPQFICGVRLRWGVKPAGRNTGAWPADMFKSKTFSCPGGAGQERQSGKEADATRFFPCAFAR